MHTDLRHAVQQALRIPRADARAHAQRFGWDAAARLFREYLVPARPATLAQPAAG